MGKNTTKDESKAYLIGAGIASLSTAVYLINDGGFCPQNIHIFDSAGKPGGSLDAKADEKNGYIMRGIRMFDERSFTSTLDLMSLVPSLANPDKTIKDEFDEFNAKHKTYSKARLLKDKQTIDPHPLGLKTANRLRLFLLIIKDESSFYEKKIEDFFSPSFFRSNFWFEFSTVFSFQAWHSLVEFRRYFIRFIHDFPVLDTLETIEITPNNQYESLVLPIASRLKEQGVNFILDADVFGLEFTKENEKNYVKSLKYKTGSEAKTINVRRKDLVFTTLGSITANSEIGSMNKPPAPIKKAKSPSWKLWENIAEKYPAFGKPKVFSSNPDASKWISFTVTFRDRTFFRLIQKFINKKITSYGGLNIVDSNWLLSIVLSYLPYFSDQKKDVGLLWGYGLFADNYGNYVKKKMSDCGGREILTELCCHLGFEKHLDKILKESVCIPVMMPYITSLFMPRSRGDRPLVVPEGSKNFAFIGQFCEMPEDTVFTVEYSVRSAQTAVFGLLGLDKSPSPIYHGNRHPTVLAKALKTLFR